MRTARSPVTATALTLLLCLHCAQPERGRDEPDGQGGRRAPEAKSACLGLDDDACRANPDCEAIPYWGESLVACNVDERGFADNCPSEGCRPAGAACPTLGELSKRCPSICSYNDFGVDPATGCRTCACRH